MKYFIYLGLLLVSSAVYGQDTASEHLSTLNAEFDPIKKDTWDYIKQVSRGKNANRIEKKRQELTLTLAQAKSRVTKIPSYKGDFSLKKAYANYLNLSYLVIKDDYKKIVDLELIAEETYDAMEAYILTKERVSAKMDSANEVLSQAYEDFAEKYNITLVEGEKDRLSRKLESAGEVNHYQNQLYLIFYKSNFYEGQMINAQNENRIGDVEQFRQTLSAVTKEGLEEVRKIPGFRSDNTLKYSLIKMLNFYQAEADEYMPQQIEFYSKSDKMNALQKNMESKKKKDITQEDVDEYNQAIEDYNAAINDFNKVNEYLNQTRSSRLDNFNDTRKKFADEHI